MDRNTQENTIEIQDNGKQRSNSLYRKDYFEAINKFIESDLSLTLNIGSEELTSLILHLKQLEYGNFEA